MICLLCPDDSGSHVICRNCRHGFSKMTKAEKNAIMRLWHALVIQKGHEIVSGVDMFRCHHCKQLFPRDRITGDHYPYSKGASPQRKFDVNNGVPSCMPCNQSDNPLRKRLEELNTLSPSEWERL